MLFYYMTKSKGRAGCAGVTWHKTEAYKTKKDLRTAEGRWGRVIEYVFTETQLVEKCGEANAKKIIERAY